MVQAHTGPGFSDPGLTQILSVYSSLDAAFGVAQRNGGLVYLNPALEALLSRCGFTASEARLPQWVEENAGDSLFQPSGDVNPGALPFLGKVRLKSRNPDAESPEALLRIETCPSRTNSLLCTILPYPHSSLRISPRPLSRRWKLRIEEIGDSFDIGRIGAKTCKIIEDLTQARAVAFYWLHATRSLDGGGELTRAEQIGQVRFLSDTPQQLDVREDWIQMLAREGVMGLPSLKESLRTGNRKPPPAWLAGSGDGFILACKTRGDLLGIAIAWTDTSRLDLAGLGDLLDQISSQAAQAVDHARWFQFARQSESRGAQMIENANAIMVGMDLQGRITLWNRKAREVFGYDSPEILGKPIFGLFGPGGTHREHAQSRFKAALSTGESLTDFETVMVDKIGGAHHVIWNTGVLKAPDGTILGLCAVGQDVTRRKELERRLAASERRYRNLVETTHDLYWVLLFDDAENLDRGEVAFLNRPFAGRDRETIVGQGIEPLRQTFRPDSWERFEKACKEVLRSERPVQHIETEHVGDGEIRTSVYMMHDLFPCYEDDVLVGVQGLTIDITRHKEVEAQMLQAQKLESVGTLARGIAHDFNNILNGINGFTFMIQRRAEEPETILQGSRAIQDLVQRASGLTRQLQTYARQGRPEKRPLDLNEILRQAMKILQAGSARNVAIQADFDENLDWIEADRSQIEQVVMNLCINAMEAMPDGGTLTLRTRSISLDRTDPILPANADAGAFSLLQVIDTGAGMSPQVKMRIFDPFYTTKKTGNGLGLSAVYGILKAHQALVRVDSEIGVGSSFSLYFPSVDAKRVLLGDTRRAQVRGGNETILVVDDESPVRVVCRDILSSLGYRVILASDGEAAVRIFQERPHAVNLVVMDIAMPNLNGCAAAKAMRMVHPEVRILFTSGYTDKAQIETLAQDGFPHFLGKPYSMLDLQETVRKILDEKTGAVE